MRLRMLSILVFVSVIFQASFAQKPVSATEGQGSQKHSPETSAPLDSNDTCTDRCHVGFMAYDAELEYADKCEVFRHGRHLKDRELHCISCHDDVVVNNGEHGKLLINQEDCLTCHHVESEELECKRCHMDIDTVPMKFNNERFLHGFTVDDDVDCGLCHQKDPTASLVRDIDCIKCHHTTPDLDCIKCHNDDLENLFTADLLRQKNLLWSVGFDHSAHPEQEIQCNKCHVMTTENDTGVREYDLNCSQCHHLSDQDIDCIKCHKEPFEFSKGKKYVGGVGIVADQMSRAVTCTDCHLFSKDLLKFLGVREKCTGCHNNNYGKLYDAWITVIGKRIERFKKKPFSSFEKGDHLKSPGSNLPDEVGNILEPALKPDTLSDRDQNILNLVEKYGLHNFNMARLLLDYLEGNGKGIPVDAVPGK